MSLHPFEVVLASLLESGVEPKLSDFGGAAGILVAAPELGISPLMPEFLRAVLGWLPASPEAVSILLVDFACKCLEVASDAFVLTEAVDLLDASRPLPGDGDSRCFARFLGLTSDRSAEPMARAAAVDGALRWAVSFRRRELKLLDALLGVSADDDPAFLLRAAKIIGVAYTYWRESELVEKLKELLGVEGVGQEAAFEIGMAKLASGLSADQHGDAYGCFDAAKYWFSRSMVGGERPDADAYVRCLDVLLAFARGESFAPLEGLLSALSEDLFEVKAWYSSPDDPAWLGSRVVEGVRWGMLAGRLRSLAEHLEAVSWYEPAQVVEDHLIACYSASRSILRRPRGGGVEALTCPRIEGSLARTVAHADLLKKWLRLNAEHEWQAEAHALYGRVDALIREGVPSSPTEAATVWPPVAALLTAAAIPESAKKAALLALQGAFEVQIGNASESEFALLAHCLEQVSGARDYQSNAIGRKLFGTVLIATIRFLSLRLSMSRKDDPGVAYMFESEDGKLPHESELQADYHRFMYSCLGGTEIEVPNVAGGRADVRFVCGPERLVTEVKRDSSDCSFEALETAYAAQTTDYQNVSVRLGFLLVLDQTERRVGGTPHISALVRASTIVRTDETEPRRLITVRVPGRRLLPSGLTVEAKKGPTKRSSTRVTAR